MVTPRNKPLKPQPKDYMKYWAMTLPTSTTFPGYERKAAPVESESRDIPKSRIAVASSV
jgi:hypothetical protein